MFFPPKHNVQRLRWLQGTSNLDWNQPPKLVRTFSGSIRVVVWFVPVHHLEHKGLMQEESWIGMLSCWFQQQIILLWDGKNALNPSKCLHLNWDEISMETLTNPSAPWTMHTTWSIWLNFPYFLKLPNLLCFTFPSLQVLALNWIYSVAQRSD